MTPLIYSTITRGPAHNSTPLCTSSAPRDQVYVCWCILDSNAYYILHAAQVYIRSQKERLRSVGSRQTNRIQMESPLTAQFMTGINYLFYGAPQESEIAELHNLYLTV
jgi:hypothetical protein